MKKTIFSSSALVCKTLLYTSVLKLASFLKVSFVIGSYCSFFSVAPMIAPLAGACNATIPAFASLVMLLVLKGALGLSWSWASIALMGIPSFVASLVWSHGRFISFIVPILCMALYLGHPDASVWYASLWVIPALISVTKKQNTILRSLAATFVAHAVGAVIWAYTVPMTYASWTALAPLALVERIIFAAGMSLVYASGCTLAKVLKTKTSVA